MKDRYIKCLKKELECKIKKIEGKYVITTIYIGGGTPSYIDSRYIKEVLDIIKNSSMKLEDVEITIEVNPGTITEEKLVNYKEAGVNRLSIGLQSTSNILLKEIGRIHTFEDFIETYNLARRLEFNNINIDLMLGLPNQTIQDLKNSIENITKLQPEHISVYSLILEEGTKLYNLVEKEKIELPDEELERQMYWYTKNTLELSGYNHYEISNFAKPGLDSKHNVNCWKQKEYIGVGLNASSYFDGMRCSNISNLNKYLENIEANELEKNKIVEEIQNDFDKKKEFMLLGLRMIEGISIQEFKNKFGENPLFLFRAELDKLVNNKLLNVNGDKIKLTNKGLDLANQVWMEFA